MARRAAFSFRTAGVLVCGNLVATHPRIQPAPPSATPPAALAQTQSTAHVTLGQSAVPLYGPWKFIVGDSPIDPKTGQPLWTEPGFDDSKWEKVDLTPKDAAFYPVAGLSGYVPGWTAKGHPGYFGYAWYRIRVQVQARPGAALALAGPVDVDDAYQVFDNGELARHFGDFTGSKPVVYYTQPKMFTLAPADNRPGPGETSPAEQSRVLAFRLWMQPHDLIAAPDAGGMLSAPVLGEAAAVTAGYQMHWLELIRGYAFAAAQALLFGFERVHELLRTAKTAAGVASAAQAFGQEDDISVISGTRAAALKPAAA